MKQKYLILLAVVLVFGFSFHYFSRIIIREKNKKIAGIDNTIKRNQERLNSAKVLNEQLQEVSKVIKNTITDEQQFSNEEINSFVKQLADLADQYKIAINSIFPKSVYSAGKILEQEYVLDITVEYIQLGQLLTSLESLDQVVKVKTIDVKPIRSETQKTEVDLEIVTRYNVILELSTFKITKEA
ncbi:MAG: type 4a pilus biogenesis protein PilO [Candidatus Cloacimonetes bacterium]|nr:type 4a pilus biogenesis protein PilO [Candidatus Cloacimonadota bacterium]